MFKKVIIRSFCIKNTIQTSVKSSVRPSTQLTVDNTKRFYNIHNNDQTKLINELKFDIIEHKMENYKLRNDIIKLKNELVELLKNIK